MNPKTILLRMVVLIATMMCALGVHAQEAYACYTSDNTTLTFYYDNQRSSQSGTTYDLNTGNNTPGWCKEEIYKNVTKVVFDSSFADILPTTTYFWFYGMMNLETIEGMSNLRTSEVKEMSYMFDFCYKLTSLDLSGFNTRLVAKMDYMFNQCTSLRTIYVGDGWTTSAVTSSRYMFNKCTSLVGGQGTTYNADYLDKTYAHIDGGTGNPGYFTEKPIEAYACYTPSNTTLTFYYDNQRNSRPGTTYDLNTGATDTGWDTDGTKADVTKVVFAPSFVGARPTTTYDWFYNMANLQSIEGMNYLNTSEVTNMAWMFSYCENLTSLDLSSFNTSKVTNMNSMFYNCSNLRTIYVGNGWSTAAVTSSSMMFINSTSLVGGKNTAWNASNPKDKTYAHIDGGPSNPGYFSEKPNEAYACYTSTNKTLTFYYDNLRNTREGKTYNLNRVGDLASWINDGNNAYVTKVVFDPLFADARPTSTYGWFYQMENLQTIEGLSYLNTSEVTDMTYMFGYCKKLTSLNLSSFNTSKVSDMKYMFYSCLNLQTIIVGDGWSTAAVTSSSNMFMGCRVLVGGQGTNYDVNHVNKTYARVDGGTSNPGYFCPPGEAYACYTSENTTLTFYYDHLRSTRLNTYDLNTGSQDAGWDEDGTKSDVTKVVFSPSFADARPTSTYGWFYKMENLQTIEGMSYLNTSEVTNMAWMFSGCNKLTYLDLNRFNTSKVAQMDNMFGECFNLQTIYVGDGWNTEAVMDSRYMFLTCLSLMGGKGTTWTYSNPMDKTYAHIDGGSINPGYFTYKGSSGVTTDLHQVTSDKSQVISDEWFTIDGQKLSGKPTKKGVYIHNGRAVVL